MNKLMALSLLLACCSLNRGQAYEIKGQRPKYPVHLIGDLLKDPRFSSQDFVKEGKIIRYKTRTFRDDGYAVTVGPSLEVRDPIPCVNLDNPHHFYGLKQGEKCKVLEGFGIDIYVEPNSMSDVQYYCTKTHSNVVQWTLDHAEKGRSSKELMFVKALNQETKHPEVVLMNGNAFNAYLVSSGKRQFIENQSGELVFIDNSKREMVGEAGEKVKFSILFEGYGKGPAGDYILAQSQRELDDLWKNLLQTNTPPPLVDFQRNFAIAEFPRELYTSPTEDSVKAFGDRDPNSYL